MNRFKEFFFSGRHKDNTIKFLADRLATVEAEKDELKQKLETSRRLYSVERQARERAQDAAEFLTNQNTFLQNALMRAMNTYKEAYRENKEEKQNHGAV